MVSLFAKSTLYIVSRATPLVKGVARETTGADPGFVNRGFVINARKARGKILSGHAYV